MDGDNWTEASYEIERLKDEIARLTRERDEAERTIGALKHLIGEQTDEIARLTRERDEAVKTAVWAARRATFGRLAVFSDGIEIGDETMPYVAHDGTDAGIYRALREAMGASEGSDER